MILHLKIPDLITLANGRVKKMKKEKWVCVGVCFEPWFTLKLFFSVAKEKSDDEKGD